MRNKSNLFWIKIVAILAVLGVLSIMAGLYIDWLWFKSLNIPSVFIITVTNKVSLFMGVFLFSGLFFWYNLGLTKRNVYPDVYRPPESELDRGGLYLNPQFKNWTRLLQGQNNKWIYVVVSLLAALVVTSTLQDKWIVVQQFIHRVPFGITDPVFGRDLGYYFFTLSFYQFLYGLLMLILILTIVMVGLVYLLHVSTEILLIDWKKEFTFAKIHLAILGAGLFALLAWGYKLATFGILYSPHGVIYGAGYTDIYARLLACRILIWVALLVAVAIVVNIFIKRFRWVLYSIGLWVLLAICLGSIYPSLIQKFVVQPNEFNKEKTYIEAGIKYTRMAYGLDGVETKDFNIDYSLTMNDIKNNSATISNIRLWDWQPLMSTYRSLQELRPYYIFSDVDIDRYTVDGTYRQIMLSPREMELGNLPDQAKTWINQRLMFTHGYGLVMSPVNEIAQEGLPQFFIKDIPPQSNTNIKVSRPEIYFGETSNPYVIVDTKQPEFNYPMGNDNEYNQYQGNNGIKINSWPRRLLLSWVLKDYQMILSNDISNSSQVLLNRNILERIKKVAPYLGYDADPYMVISQDGKLFWLQDAYTFSDKYPYSQPYNSTGDNYVRNSVKVVVDAYTGEMTFYVSDPADPIIQTYQQIFPQLYKPIADMPNDLKLHVRYPVDLLSIQAEIYRSYHMSDPEVFYNKEDQWVIPTEMVDGQEKQIQPYYIIMRLPGEKEAEYILMLPYTPSGRPNMIAWMCARMDGEEYGKKLVYQFPKQETVYGPMQIESRINQNTDISQQLTLWDQKGSSTLRGNLVIIPINNSILYIEPLYLQAESSQMPELKRVIAAYGDQVVMEETLDKALAAIFSGNQAAAIPNNSSTTATDRTIQELVQLARQYYDQANERLKAGDWAGYGENINKLNDIITSLEQLNK